MTVFDEIYQYFKDHPDEPAFMWTRYEWTYPPPKPFLECAFLGRDFVALFEGRPAPDPATIRVQVVKKATPGLRVRRKPIDGEIMGMLQPDAIVTVLEIQKPAGWYTIASGVYVGAYISAAYVEKVT